MKMIVGLFFSLVALLPVEAVALQIVADSKITAVTVFGDRAMVQRTALVRLASGDNTVIFGGLPLQIAEETLRAEGKGTAAARISGLSVRNVFLDSSSEKRTRDLEEEIAILERAVQKIEARRTALAAQRAFIDSIRVGWGERISKELSSGKPVSAELTEANRFVGAEIFRVEEGAYDAAAEKKPLADKIAALRKQLDALQSERGKEVRTVELAITAPVAMELTVELSYLVMQAKWEPVYDIRLAADGKSAELAYRAMVAQHSGEDWRGVKLSLSTATPASGSAPPELLPWQVFLREPSRPMAHPLRGAYKAAAAAPVAAGIQPEAAESMEYGAGDLLQLTAVSSQLQDKQTSVLFVVPEPADIAADGSRQNTLLAIERLPVSSAYETIPKLSPRIYLKSEVVNSSAYPLLAGTVNVFNDNVFVGRSVLKTAAPGEKFTLFFGVDDAIKVKRQATRIRREAGLINDNRLSWRCLVELENFKKEAVTVAVYDQIPVAGNQEIKATLAEQQPDVFERRSDGTVSWQLSLNPGEKHNISYRINVEYPQGREIVGAE